MKEKPILFSGPMVRAILGGWKSQTRRPIAGSGPDTSDIRFDVESGEWYCEAGLWHARCPLGVPGDRLWVREKWQAIHVFTDEWGNGDDLEWARKIPVDPGRPGMHADHIVLDMDHNWWQIVYAASDPDADASIEDRGFPWRPSLHMPRWASRLMLGVEAVRVERLDITEADAMAEGYKGTLAPEFSARSEFKQLWESIYGDGSWAGNLWVWVGCFRVVEKKG